MFVWKVNTCYIVFLHHDSTQLLSRSRWWQNSSLHQSSSQLLLKVQTMNYQNLIHVIKIMTTIAKCAKLMHATLFLHHSPTQLWSRSRWWHNSLLHQLSSHLWWRFRWCNMKLNMCDWDNGKKANCNLQPKSKYMLFFSSSFLTTFIRSRWWKYSFFFIISQGFNQNLDDDDIVGRGMQQW
jgi:hypothetical protein